VAASDTPNARTGGPASCQLKVAGYSYREICALTGASYTNVNKHLTRGGRARVREARSA